MTGQPVDLPAILQSLQDHEVDFVLFGSTAMLFYGYVRNTEDVDIVVGSDEGNLRRVHDWLVSIDAHLLLRPARPFGPRERWQMFKGANATVTTAHGTIDVVQRIDGMPPWEELVAESEVYQRGDVAIKVMNRRTLIELKRRRASAQDLADIEAIALLDELDD